MVSEAGEEGGVEHVGRGAWPRTSTIKFRSHGSLLREFVGRGFLVYARTSAK